MLLCTITEGREIARKLTAVGIPIGKIWLIPKAYGAQAEDILVQDAIDQYGVDPDFDLVEVYLSAMGSNKGTGGHIAALLRKPLDRLASEGVGAYQALYQDFYPGAEYVSALLNIPKVADGIKAILAAI